VDNLELNERRIAMNAKFLQNLLIFLAIILAVFLSFLIVEHYGCLVNGILGLSVIFLLYRINVLPISNIAATVNMLQSIRNPNKLKGYVYIFFCAVIFSVAMQEIFSMFMVAINLFLSFIR
jgi:hypothetical protein